MNGRTDSKVMRIMTHALRAEPVPDLAWDRIEQKLFDAIDAAEAIDSGAEVSEARERLTRPAAPRVEARPRPHWFGYAAAAALLALGIQGAARAPITATAPAAAPRTIDVAAVPLSPHSDAHDVATLSEGDAIETGADSASFVLSGTVRWELEPNSRAVVRSLGEKGIGHAVRLERGALHAEVVPRDPAEGLVESFAVEVEHTRIAVHGTAFRVAREADGVLVDVEHGAVAVGPTGHIGVTTGHLLVGPSRATFSFDGGRFARLLPRVEEPQTVALEAPKKDASSEPASALPAQPVSLAAASAASRSAQQPTTNLVPASANAAAAPASQTAATAGAQPSASPTLTVDGIRAGLARCFTETYGETAPSVKLSVSTTFHITLRSGGTVQAARFDPPLKPEFQACAGNLIGGRFAQQSGEITIPVQFGTP